MFKKMFFKSTLPATELFIYFIIWVGSVFYSIYCFAIECNQFFQYYEDEFSDFTTDSFLSRRKKDIADYEWETFKYLIEKLYLWILLSTIVSELLRKVHLVLILQIWQIFITITFIYTQMGSLSLSIILFQPIVFSTLPNYLNKTMIWCSNAVILLLISIFKYFIASEDFLSAIELNDKMAYISILSIFWINLRCVSFCLDFTNKDQKPGKIKFFAYVLYLPLMFSGPFIPYKDFQGENKTFSNRVSTLLVNLARFTFWSFFIECLLHYIYINATSFHPEWVETLDSWSLYGYGYLMGQFFHLKYLVIYGLTTSFAYFDHIKVPSLPVCIGRIHLYSDMWKYFDAGLYNFLLNYIYLPLMDNTAINNKFISSFVCFAFVYIWHGTDDYILIWTFFNYIGIVLEGFAKIVKNHYLKQNSNKVRRVACALASPLLALSAISNFYFFARSAIGNIFISHILKDSFTSNAILLSILYCCCQVSTELRNRKKKIKST